MEKNTIRSHRARVKKVNELLACNPAFQAMRISFVDKEAFVEFLLLEDIVGLYQSRLRALQTATPSSEVREKIKTFTAVIDGFSVAIGMAQAAIDSGYYKRVWKAVHEGALMTAAKNIRHLPELKLLMIELLRDLSDEMKDEATAEVEEVIRAAEEAIPDRKKAGKANHNT